MINTAQDFSSSLAYVTQDIGYTGARLSNEMSSTVINYTFAEIEETLNTLYEKIRTLEDMRDYTKDFVVRAIQERREKIIGKLKVIETLTDELQSKESVITIAVPDFNCTVYDRDGSEIAKLYNDNNLLIVPGNVLAAEEATAVINKGPVNEVTVPKYDPAEGDYSAVETVPIEGAEPFASSDTKIRDQNSHFDIYHGNEPVPESFKVKYDIQFAGNIMSNYVDFNPVNCNIVDIKLYDTENNVISLQGSDRYFPLTRLVRAEVIVENKNYDRYEVEVPVERMSDSFDNVITGGEIYA